MEQARSLDPLTEDATYDLAWILIMAGRWEQALRTLEPAVARHPQASELHRAFGFCLLYTGQAQEARAAFARVLELNAGDRWATPNLVQPLVALGEISEAKSLLAEIERRAEYEPMSPVGIAIAHHCLGNNDLAIAWLERAIEERYYWLVMLRFDPSMAGLHADPRFEALMNRVFSRRVDHPRGDGLLSIDGSDLGASADRTRFHADLAILRRAHAMRIDSAVHLSGRRRLSHPRW
jgi:tetratricopeptide (TPR) repeat protein